MQKLLSAGDPQASVGYKRHFVTTFIIDGKGENGKIFLRMRKKPIDIEENDEREKKRCINVIKTRKDLIKICKKCSLNLISVI